ncbi:MAG: hypothetical protein IJ489_02470 [Clostridia bacterium]|nr:hypothetical protein [Clostridia bacterium]
MSKLKNYIWGILLILLGALVAVDAMGIREINFFFDGFWTLFIIIPCAVGLLTENDKKGDLIGLVIGVFLLLVCRDIVDIDMLWKLLVPAILIIIGISIIFKGNSDKKFNAKVKNLHPKASYCAIFSGEDLNFNGAPFEGAELNAIFGGMKLDLRNALIDSDVVIHASAVFGGIDIYVPQNLNVKVQSSSLFGGVSGADNFRNPKTKQDQTFAGSDAPTLRITPEQMPTVYIKASCIFGGVTLK